MDLLDLTRRERPPKPWTEGDNIPWNDPDFSERMLKEHLSQEHDAASRRFDIIDRHVDWIHHTLLDGQPAQVLDLACGPGLYASRLARLGHAVVGIDYAPASIRYAREEAERDQLSCRYHLEDLRTANFGSGYRLAILLYGEFNVFPREQAARILARAYDALEPGGLLLLEPHTYAAVQEIGEQPSTWSAQESGLFSDRPHLLLKENFWDDSAHAATTRHYWVDAESAAVSHCAASYQAYTDDEYREILETNGFSSVWFAPPSAGLPDALQSIFLALVARRE